MLHVASLLPQGPSTQIQRVTENKANDVQGVCLPCSETRTPHLLGYLYSELHTWNRQRNPPPGICAHTGFS